MTGDAESAETESAEAPRGPLGADGCEDPYRRLNYRRLIAWPQRIEREWPFLEGVISSAPLAAVLDLGCGTGEHARHIASRGIRAVGIDRSVEQIAAAREYEGEFPPHGPQYLCGDLVDLGELTDERFGAALCLGNVLPHLERPVLDAALAAIGARLVPDGRLILQWLNYERLARRKIRHLPLNWRPHPDGGDREILFLRLVEPTDDERYVLFYPTTLTVTPGSDRPVEVEATKEVRLRAWRRAEVEERLTEAGLAIESVFGDMERGAYDPDGSSDVVVIARRV